MTDSKSADDKTTEKQSIKKASTEKASTAKSTSDSSAGKKESTAKPAVKPAAAKPVTKSTAKSTAKSAATTKATVTKEAFATIEKAGASKDADMKAAAKKISTADKKSADNAIKSKKGIEDLKTRAHEAKQRAQKKILEEAYVSDKPTDPLERLANTFDSSAKRWEMVVYPSLFAFVLLAGYGFFLIYRLTHDISTLSQSVTRMAVIVSDSMPRMTRDLKDMTGSIDNMTGNIDGMTTEIVSMSGQMNSLTPMSKNIQSMTNNLGSMNRSVYGMQRDMHGMNRTVSSGPFGMMGDVMPFSSDTNVPPALPPQAVWPSYNPNPAAYQVYTQPPLRPARPVKPVAPQETITQNKVVIPARPPVPLKK